MYHVFKNNVYIPASQFPHAFLQLSSTFPLVTLLPQIVVQGFLHEPNIAAIPQFGGPVRQVAGNLSSQSAISIQ